MMKLFKEENKLMVEIPNTEALVECQINITADRSVTGYYTNDNIVIKQEIESFLADSYEYYLDISETKKFIEEVYNKIYNDYNRFYKGRMSRLLDVREYFSSFNDLRYLKIPEMFFQINNRRYLKFNKDNKIVMHLLLVLYGEITGFYIEKKDRKYIIMPFLRENYVQILNRKTATMNENESKEEDDIVFKSSNIIYYGQPGSGKSYTVSKMYCQDDNKYERITFHPEYTNADFIGQIIPVIYDIIDKETSTVSKQITFEFKEGPFTRILSKAYSNPDTEFFLIIEEINRGNAPAIFGDVFQLLDRQKSENGIYKIGDSQYPVNNREIEEYLVNNSEGNFKEGDKIIIPRNLSIIATMNTSDQNVFTLDTAFKRRWQMEKVPNTFPVDSYVAKMYVPGTSLLWKSFVERINSEIVNDKYGYNGEDKQLGAFFVAEIDLSNQKNDYSFEKIHSFADKVLMYLWEDAFKYNRKDIFPGYQTLEQLTNDFVGEKRLDIFGDIFISNEA